MLNPFNRQELSLAAYARCVAVPAPALFAIQNQGAILARTGVGVYTLTFDPGLGIVEGQLWSTVQFLNPDPPAGATGPACAKVTNTSDTVKTISIVSPAGVPADIDFEVIIWASNINPTGP